MTTTCELIAQIQRVNNEDIQVNRQRTSSENGDYTGGVGLELGLELSPHYRY